MASELNVGKVVVGNSSTNELLVGFESSSQDFSLGANGTNFMVCANATDLDANELLRISSTGQITTTTTSADAMFIDSSHATRTSAYIRNSNATTNNTAELSFAPANSVAGAKIVAEAKEDFSVEANRTADLVFHTRNNGTMAEAVRIDSTGHINIPNKIRIGTSGTPTEPLHIDGDGTADIMLSRTTGATSGELGRIFFGALDGDAHLASVEGYQDGAVDAGGLKFSTEATGGNRVNRLIIDSTGQSTFTRDGLAVTSNRTGSDGDAIHVRKDNYTRLRLTTLGITFPNGGTAPVSAPANRLAFYEEGTFTPTAWDNDTTQITTSIAVGRYVRIGRMCHVSLRLKRNDTMTGTSNVYFRGLPFSSQNEGTTNDTKNIGIGGCWLPSDTEHGMAYALPGTANFIFIDAKAADGGYLTTADWGNTYNWYAAFTYEVA